MRISQAPPRQKSRVRPGETVILFLVGGFTFAIGANAVDEIREFDGLTKFSFGTSRQEFAKVKHSFERQGQNCFVVDAAAHFRMSSSEPARLLVLRHAPAAVAVDGIDG